MTMFQSTGNATLDAIAVGSGAATPELVVEWAVLLGLVILFTGLRTYARAKVGGFKGLSWDDYLVWVAVLFYAALSVNVYIIGVMLEGLAADGIYPEDRRAALALDQDGQEFRMRRFGAMAQVVKLLFYALVLWTLKAALLYYFAIRLTGDVPGARVRTWASVGLLLVTFLGSLASLLTSCRPFQNMWQLYPDPGVMCQANISPLIIAVFLGCNILSDIYLISMPIPVLIRAPLSTTQKLSLISLFSCNILITGMAIVRAYFIIQDPWINGDGLWEVRETFVAVITTCIPPIAPLLKSWFSFGGQEKLTTAERVEAAKNRGSRSSMKRSASKATKKTQSQIDHNDAMRDRYLSGFEEQEKAVTYEAGGTNTSRSNGVRSTASMAERMGGTEFENHLRQAPHALTTPERTRTRGDPAEDTVPQTVHEIV